MKMTPNVLGSLIGAASVALWSSSAYALVITPTTDSATLAAALGGSGLTINSAAATNGVASQFGVYEGFTSPPVTIGNGVVLSSGQVAQVLPSFNNGISGLGTTPSTPTGAGGTAEFGIYGSGTPGITNFLNSNDVARLQVDFTLAAPGKIQFSFIFGSVEYPEYTADYTDAFLVFLDGVGVANQIAFDNAGNPVQVGASFSSLLTTADTNTAFADPHGLISNLTTVSPELPAGAHTLLFEVGDVNDAILDSAAFIADFGVCTPVLGAQTCEVGTTPPGNGPPPYGAVPEPTSLALLGVSLAGLGLSRRRKLH